MTGDFRITLEYLKGIDACAEGRREFSRAFPNGAGYQEALDRCAEEGRIDFGTWLLNNVGRTDDVRTYDENINDSGKIIIFAGKLKFKFGVCAKFIKAGRGIEAEEGIQAGRGIQAGWGIQAGEGIEAGRGIEAGCGIQAGEGIEAGEDYGIFAGVRIRVALWEQLAIVTAKKKPKNLISGYWISMV